MNDIQSRKNQRNIAEEPESVVIVRRPQGWVAHVRYKNHIELNEDIATTARWMLLARIERHFE